MSVGDRAGLLNDAYALARAGHLDPARVVWLLQVCYFFLEGDCVRGH